MTISMHALSVPVFRHMLVVLGDLLAKAADSGLDEATILDARIAPDMYPFCRQVQLATDFAKGAATRLSGQPVPSYPDTETTLAELAARVERTLALVNAVPAEAMQGAETREIVLKVGPREIVFDGQTYLLHFVLPNLFFHVTTAYDLLRMAGVPLGKRDFLGTPEGGVPAWLRPTEGAASEA